MNQPMVGFGTVRHIRLRPVVNAFAYSTFFLMLPMRTLHAKPAAAGALAHNRAGLVSFHDSDHGDGRANSLQWIDEMLARHGVHDATGEAWLHCYPRVLGYAFKPVSFWYCHAADGQLRAIVVEVNNTFGERHCYVLDEPAWGRELQATKAFHVSPFCRVEGTYRFRFFLNLESKRTLARIDHDTDEGPLLRTSVGGVLKPATKKVLYEALWRHPVMTLAVIARIHWQALRLWRARVPFVPHPGHP